MIALADCNNFFASCERSIRPELEGKPIVVLSNNDGCIIARSNEAKALGYKMGEPVKRQTTSRQGSYVFRKYGIISRYIRKNHVHIKFNAIEVYSIDEAFMDFTSVAAEEKASF